MKKTWTVAPGAQLVYDGEMCTVAEIGDGAVIVRTADGSTRRLRMLDVLRPASEGGTAHVPGRLPDDEESQPLMLVWSDATESAQAAAHERADHVREVLTGYRSGSREIAREGEPRFEYHPQRSLGERQTAKAKELGIGTRTLERWVSRYRDTGEAGLIDTRRSRTGAALTNFDPRWVDAARTVIDEQGNQSKVQKKIILARIAARVERVHGPEVVTLPSTASGYRALDELSRGRATFSGSTKAKRSIANR
ncbi:helix-turn-helix domain-containing protein, partial [Microbacterium sp. Leaf351]